MFSCVYARHVCLCKYTCKQTFICYINGQIIEVYTYMIIYEIDRQIKPVALSFYAYS